VDGRLLVRAFLVLGPAEAVCELLAYTLVLFGSGFRPAGSTPSAEALLAASGTAFVSIVAGQTATALACRSDSRTVFRVPIARNLFVPAALAVSWALALVLLYVPGFARLLGHGPPPARGLVLAALAFPAVLVVDSALKAWQSRADVAQPRPRERGSRGPKR
jgi:magnesium-transporting ATPase (P-type)